MERAPEKLPLGKLILFALGQMGWSLASYGVSNLLVYFYMPPETATAAIFPAFLFQGAFVGFLTITGVVNFGSRLFDAVTNPIIASWSDRSPARMGRRRFFMAISAAPFALFAVLVFIPLQHFHAQPTVAQSWLNIVWLVGTILLFYFFFVMYNAPFNALIAELGHNPRERLIISTVISVTWALGFAVGNFVYEFQGLFEKSGMSSVSAFQTVEIIFGVVSFILMLLPVLFIDERRYAAYSVSHESTGQALTSALRNSNFFRFLVSELLYFICQTVIQMGVVYYVVTLLGLEKELTSFLMIFMFLLSFAFYPLVTWSSLKLEKKRVLMVGFALLAVLFLCFALMGVLPIRGIVFAYVTIAIAALPMAIFGIVPNAIVADIAEADGIETGNFKAGMFFGIRTFETNLGTSIANGLFPSLLLLGKSVENPFGIRMTAIVSVAIALLGMFVFVFYDERKVLRSLAKKEKLTGASAREAGAAGTA
ncbi:MAG TPA: MFS transporter [Spirochaetia bacterium]|nr:MFS transporter [Spirochaetia bacterium]